MKTEKEFPVINNNVRGVNGNMEVDLERALDLCGAGKYQVYHCTIMIAILGASVLELIGYSFILPAGACDLGLSDSLRGIITSLPNIGIIITAPFWGRAADALGRKPVLLYSTAMSGIVGLIASFMPGLFSFALCKFVGSLFISCASSLGFAYAGEMMPRKRRDIAVLMCNALLMLFAAFCPILAWGVLSYNWFDAISVHPWRVLTAVYAIPLILSALWLTQAKESPKFLMTKNKPQEALEVLRHIYDVNTGYGEDNYCVTSLTNSAEDSEKVMDSENTGRWKNSAFALLRPPHLKWMALTGFLMFGLFSLLNGLFLFAPNTINKMMTSSDEPVTICMILNQPVNQTEPTTCVDDISYGTFQITIVASLIYGTLVLLVSLSPLTKKTLLVGMYAIIGGTCLVSAVATNRIIAGISMSALQVTALGIGPLTAYSVQLFPTNLRGTAVGAVLMFGRVGSVVGANVSGVFLASACTATFYVFAALLFICAGLSFLLPNEQTTTGEETFTRNDGFL